MVCLETSGRYDATQRDNCPSGRREVVVAQHPTDSFPAVRVVRRAKSAKVSPKSGSPNTPYCAHHRGVAPEERVHVLPDL
jgi:hypothetical protein